MDSIKYKKLYESTWLGWEGTFQIFENEALMTQTVVFLRAYIEQYNGEKKEEEKKCVDFLINILEFYLKTKIYPLRMDNIPKIFINFFRYKLNFCEILQMKKLLDEQEEQKHSYLDERMRNDFIQAQEYAFSQILYQRDNVQELQHKLMAPSSIDFSSPIQEKNVKNNERTRIILIEERDNAINKLNFYRCLEKKLEEADKQQFNFYKNHQENYRKHPNGGYVRKEYTKTALNSF